MSDAKMQLDYNKNNVNLIPDRRQQRQHSIGTY